ncbi:PAS domain-containing protein [Methanocella arvoryzae]|uniref:PAS domain-containing protein n=1 Tax=Methanocella arvoryzae TaxID=1175445 RepID=UPI0003219BAA|nr:PAS domain S-box protein [Methanocella arvoryzae]
MADKLSFRLSGKYKELILGSTLVITIFLAIYINLRLGIEIVYTHLFYVPIILAGVWYHRKGVLIAVFLGLLHIYLGWLAYNTIMPEPVIRALIFVIIAYVIGTLSERKDQLHDDLAESRAKLSESLRQLSNVIEFYPDATLIIDNNGRVVAWNKAIEDMTGVKAADMIGKGDNEYAVPFYGYRRSFLLNLVNLTADDLRDRYTDISVVNGRFEAVTADATLKGRKVILHCTASKLYDDSGNVIGAIESIRDVTAQKKMEAELQQQYASLTAQHELLQQQTAEINRQNVELTRVHGLLKESEENYRAITTSVNDCILTTDLTGTCTYLNPRVTELTGYAPDDILNTPVNNLVAEESGEIVSSILSSVSRDERRSVEIWIHAKSGKKMLIELNTSIICDAAGNPVGIVGAFRDITERKLAEEKLIELSRAVEQSPSIVIITDARGKIDYVNPKYTQVSGYTLEDIKGYDPHKINAASLTSEQIQERNRALRQGNYWRGELSKRKKNGELYWVSASVSPVRNKDGEIIRYVDVEEDITERKMVEVALKHANDELVKANEVLENRVLERTEALTHAHNTLEAIMQNIQIGVVVVQRETGEVSYYTTKAMEILSGPVMGIASPGRNRPYEFLKPDGSVLPDERQPLYRSLQHGENVRNEEVLIRRKDGSTVTVLMSSTPIVDPEGKVVSAVVGMLDITDRKRAEQAAGESQEKFRSIAENINDWIWEADENAVFTYSSPKIREILGYEPEEVIGKKLYDLMYPDEAKRFKKAIDLLYFTREPFTYLRTTLIGKGGTLATLEYSGRPIFDKAGTFRGYRGVSRDISERKRSENALLRSEARMKALMSAAPGTIILVNKVGHFLDCKVEAGNHLFPKPDDIVAKNAYEVLPIDLARILIFNVNRALKTGKPQTFEYQFDAAGQTWYQKASCVACGGDEAIVFVQDNSPEDQKRATAAEPETRQEGRKPGPASRSRPQPDSEPGSSL